MWRLIIYNAHKFLFRQKALDEEIESLAKLRDTLLPKLLSGELRVESVKF